MSVDSLTLLHRLKRAGDVRRWWVGFSGGLDSHVLLHLAVAAGLDKSHQLQALHVDHGLQPEAADWADHCRRICDELSVPLTVVRVQVADAGDGAGPEARARDARYQAFEQHIGEGEGLLLAHHADDQAETLLLRLLRGSGVRGLAAIPERRALGAGTLFRPLLEFERAELEAWAAEQQLNWAEDPSNSSLEFDRNYLRHQVMPQLRQRWPHAARAFSRSARFCADAEQLSQQLAAADLSRCGDQQRLRCIDLLALDSLRQMNLLRHWLVRAGWPLPEEKVLLRVLGELIPARIDAEPCVSWGDYQVRRFQGCLRLWRRAWQTVPEKREWDLSAPMLLPFGRLDAVPAAGEGIRVPSGARVEVDFRRGGERITIAGRPGSRALKKLLQESRVPPWQRSLIPLIRVDGQLAAVAGMWIAEGFQATETESGTLLQWQPCF